MSVENVSPEKLAKIMDRIRLILAKAENPASTPAEQEMCREQAEKLMSQYRLEESELDEGDKARMGIHPVVRVWDIYAADSEFSKFYTAMASYVLDHVGAYAVWTHDFRQNTDNLGRTLWSQFKVYGFESDLAYGELLWNSIRLAFAEKLEPSRDDSLTAEENVFRMRNAGMERIRIARVMGWGDTGSATSKVTAHFKRACAARGEDADVLLGKGNSVKTFRKVYAQSFADEIWSRMWHLRTARGQYSTGLVLANRMEAVMELVYRDHPSLRPPTAEEIARRAEANKGKKARKVRARKPETVAWNPAAEARGRSAAASVDLGAVGGNRVEG